MSHVQRDHQNDGSIKVVVMGALLDLHAFVFCAKK